MNRLHELRDAQGSLLDNTLVLYGSACSTTHNAVNYPLVLAGGAGLGLQHGRYLKTASEAPLANLFVSMLQAVGIETDEFADSTGPFSNSGPRLFT